MKKAPDFSLPDQTNHRRSLKDFKGKWLVLYFYPKDDTPGCTKEACNFRDVRDSIATLGNAEVVGVSKDSVKSHAKFADKHDLNFMLLSDPEAITIHAYKSWGQKKFMGREFMGILRNTYIIDPKGMIVKEYPGVDPKTHAEEVIKDLRALQES